ncbi:MAG: two-component system sensor histidine kinase NtrB [Candidatus Anammoxibacter sp.]
MKVDTLKSGNVDGLMADDLNSAFDKFNHSSKRLADLYIKLQERVDVIDEEIERKNRELNCTVSELQRTTQYMNSILQSMHSGVVSVDLKGRVTTINKAAKEILGLEKERTIGKQCANVIVPVYEREGLLKRALDIKQDFVNQKREVLRLDKQIVWIESSVTLLRSEDGSVIGAVEIFKDLSEIKRLENRLEQAGNLASIGEMTAIIAHDIRNPLNGIKGFATLLEDGFNKKDPRKRFVNNIVKGVDNLNSMVTDLLVLAKPIKPDLKENNIEEILAEVILLAREDLRLAGNKIDIKTNYGKSPTFVRCDRNLLYQVFFNLLKNSFQAIRGEGGSVSVGINPSQTDGNVNGGKNVEISISDNGIGIDKEAQSKIFEPFFTTKSGGTGLGLSLVHKIMKIHNGRIEIKSAPGKGTTFRLLLPESNGKANNTKNEWRLDNECRPNFSYR